MPTLQRSPLPAPGSIIVLNGTSSAGKTSLAKALQIIWPTPLHHVQLNAFLDMEPPGYWSGWEARGKEATDLMLDALCGAMHTTVREYAKHGQGVILDTAITNARARQLFAEDLSDLPVYLVAVHCDLAELGRRESARGNRAAGLAASQLDWIHQKMQYDTEIDTTHKTAETAATEIAQWLATRPVPDAMHRLCRQLTTP